MLVRQLSKSLQQKAEVELNETPERRREDIQHIKDWLSKQPHLNACLDDQRILNFLRGCKFSLEKTKEKIDNYYSTRTICSEFFTNRDPFSPELQHFLKSGQFWLPLPKAEDPLAPRILYCNNSLNSSGKLDPIAQMKVIQMVMDILLHEDDSFVINGFEVIQYLGGFSLNHLSQFSLSTLRKMVNCSIHMYPARMKGFHFINVPPAVFTMYNLLKPFLSNKIQSRVFFHQANNYNDLHKIVPKSILPRDLGGYKYDLLDVLNEWINKIESYKTWLLEDEKYCSDESKRIKTLRNDFEALEVHGSFKKLEFD